MRVAIPGVEPGARSNRGQREIAMPYADNKGVKVYYETWGSGGVPIVF